MTPADRFWSRVAISPEDECWEWQGTRHKSGYGQFDWMRQGRHVAGRYAHRASWILTNGAIPDGLHVLHRCDNPPCVRPAHLFLGTAEDNTLDAQKKGRRPTALAKPPRRWAYQRLTVEQVRDIRDRYAAGDRIADIARDIGRSWRVVWSVTTGRVHNQP